MHISVANTRIEYFKSYQLFSNNISINPKWCNFVGRSSAKSPSDFFIFRWWWFKNRLFLCFNYYFGRWRRFLFWFCCWSGLLITFCGVLECLENWYLRSFRGLYFNGVTSFFTLFFSAVLVEFLRGVLDLLSDFDAERCVLLLFAELLVVSATGISGALARVYTLIGVTSFFSLFFPAIFVESLRGILDMLPDFAADFLIAELIADLTIFLIKIFYYYNLDFRFFF